RITVLRLAGRHIKAALENGFSQVEQVTGRFPHVSGLSVNVDLNAPVGNRVKHIMINGQPLEEARIYSVATSDFLAGGGDGYDALTLGTEVPFSQQVTPLIADIVISVLRRQQTISARRTGRINDMSSIGRSD
ncbi:MAG: bifunctional metallophosphatase/5'-nucleotidase, partial [Aestuariibacter sp.]|nr:bifunctional metallophosphatase/5'-nucleotidase [Aestuariibacter sp.]MCP4237970.1 bifunctional metallophosphatase/5'-nucleotidase [Aestuariibacter sp.]MCP4948573.1 bifunctional metallophosphatase/5'-nucleotidase [Aestuariibacter sp.]